MSDEDMLNLYSLLKRVDSLYTCGFNEGLLAGKPRRTKDETGVTAAQYRRTAEQLLKRVQRMKSKLRKVLPVRPPLPALRRRRDRR